MSVSPVRGAARGTTLRGASGPAGQLLTGAVLAIAAALLLLLGKTLDLELDAVVLLGVALGAVVALAPEATPGVRLAGFAGGVVAAWLGFVARAALLPDTSGGRAAAAVLVIALCTALVVLAQGRLPLWTPLLGVGALVGVYETTYSTDPALVLSTSVTAVTALLLCAVLGWLVATLTAARTDAAGELRVPAARRPEAVESTRSDDTKVEVA